jgi:hypothetical protein
MIRVELPYHLRTLAQCAAEVQLELAAGRATAGDAARSVTLREVLDALEAHYPMLRGTIRDHVTGQRRPFLRYFACGRDLSHDSPDAPLPDAVAAGDEPLIVLGAIAGG